MLHQVSVCGLMMREVAESAMAQVNRHGHEPSRAVVKVVKAG